MISKQIATYIFGFLVMCGLFFPFSYIQAGYEASDDPCAGKGIACIVPCSNKCDFGDIVVGINRIIQVVFIVLAVPLATILFAYAGFLYITAVGDEGKIKSAHRIFLNVLIGLVLMASAWLIISVIVTTLAKPGSGATQFLQGIRR